MKEYISREWLDNLLNHYLSTSNGAEHYGYNIIKQEIDARPATEIVYLREGKWILDQVETGNPYDGGTYLIDVLQCSVCGGYFDVSEARNYCPNCGAKMIKSVF